VQLTINGSRREVPEGLTVEGLLHHLELLPPLIVVERNGEILARERYPGTRLEPGDRFELVHFVGGG